MCLSHRIRWQGTESPSLPSTGKLISQKLFGGNVAEAPGFFKNIDKAGAAHGVFALQRLDAAVIAFMSAEQWRECMALWHARDGDQNMSLTHAFPW